MEKVKKSIFYSIPIIFIVGSMLHFLYDLTGKTYLFGFISSINETTWEHTKLAFIPIVLYYLIYNFINKNLNVSKWFRACLISSTTSVLAIPLLFYFITEALYIESLIIDIGIFFVAVLLGQLVAYHYYKRSREPNLLISIILLIAIFISYIVFTVNPLKVPLFEDPTDYTYGINEIRT